MADYFPKRRARQRPAASQIEWLEARILCSGSTFEKLPIFPSMRRHHTHVVIAAPPAEAPPPGVDPNDAGAAAVVVGRYVYYGATPFYGDVAAPDKSVLLPGQTADFSNVTTFDSGINEIALDVSNAASSYGAGDFTFKTGTTGDPSTWTAGPAPLSVTVAPGAGSGGSARVFIRWADGSIVNEWLQVTFLAAGDTFYLGNLIGDTGDMQVNAGDESMARNNSTTLLAPASISNAFDFNRDGKVDATDQLIARSQIGVSLPVLIAPAPPPPVSYDWHTQMIGGVLNIWAPNPSDFGTTFSVTDPTMLFGADGVPQLQAVHQGPIADCYFLAAAGALAYTNPSRIENMMANDPGGGWAVNFQYLNGQLGIYQPVVIHTNNQLSSSLQFSSHGEMWSMVMEKAYAAFRTWNGLNSQDTMASLNWGNPGIALGSLNDQNVNYYTAGRTDQGVYDALQAALAASEPILFQTASNAPSMVQSHVYVITGVSTDASGTRWVTTYNPWGYFDTRTETVLLSNGIGTFTIGTY